MPESLQCLSCHIGTVKQTRATFSQWLDGQLIMLPNCVAWKCDICSALQYDDATIRRVELVVGSQIQRHQHAHPKPAKPNPMSRQATTPNGGEPSDG